MADASSGTIVQGDVFEELTHLDADSAHAAIVDYPWEFDAENGNGRYSYERDEDDIEEALFAMEGDNRLPELLTELARVLVDGAWIIFMADDEFQDPVRDALRDSEFTFRRNWAWTPESMGMGYYGRVDHYPMPVATLGDTDRYVLDRSTLFRVPGGRQTDYPTGKPIDLYRQILRPPVIEEGERLLEPFCGSGPGTAVAAESNLRYWGCDISETAVEMARDRLETPRLTGQTKITDGGQAQTGLPDPLEGCREGFKFGCAFGCGTKWTGDEFSPIAKRAARHYNKEHGSDLRSRHNVVETVERGGSHIHGNIYQVERVKIYLTAFDMAERIGSIDGWLAGIESDRVCPVCNCIIPDRDARIEDNPADVFNESWTCRQCVAEAEVRRKQMENENLTEWSTPAGNPEDPHE